MDFVRSTGSPPRDGCERTLDRAPRQRGVLPAILNDREGRGTGVDPRRRRARAGRPGSRRMCLAWGQIALPGTVPAVAEPVRIVVLEGDETGQELLDQALRVLDAEVLGLPLALERFDLSLARRRATSNQVVHEAAA